MKQDLRLLTTKLKESQKKNTSDLFVPSLKKNLKFVNVTIDLYQKYLDLINQVKVLGSQPEDELKVDALHTQLIESCIADQKEFEQLSLIDKPCLLLQLRSLTNDKILFQIENEIFTKYISTHIGEIRDKTLLLLSSREIEDFDIKVKISVPSLQKAQKYRNYLLQILESLPDDKIVQRMGQINIIESCQFIDSIIFRSDEFIEKEYLPSETIQIFSLLSSKIIREIKTYCKDYSELFNNFLRFNISPEKTIVLDIDANFFVNL